MTFSPSNLVRGATALAIAMALTACGRSGAESGAAQLPPEVLTTQAKPAASTIELRLPARAQAAESTRIYPRATGFISERRADLGDTVKTGQVLAVISAPEIDQAVHEGEAVLTKAQADEEFAKVNFTRAQALIGSGAISRERYSEREASYGVAVAARRAAEARLAAARERQGFKSVRAPFAGVVVARNVERGDRVVGDAGEARPMFEISALDPLRVVVDVPQNVALQVRPGLEGQVTFPELPGESFQVQLVRSAQAISPDAGVMRVEMRLPNPGNRIPAGMIGTVTLGLARVAPAVVIPISAVIQHSEGARVAILQDSTLEYRGVTLGRNLGNSIEILSGLAADETVVIAPNALLTAGSKVTARPLAAEKKS